MNDRINNRNSSKQSLDRCCGFTNFPYCCGFVALLLPFKLVVADNGDDIEEPKYSPINHIADAVAAGGKIPECWCNFSFMLLFIRSDGFSSSSSSSLLASSSSSPSASSSMIQDNVLTRSSNIRCNARSRTRLVSRIVAASL